MNKVKDVLAKRLPKTNLPILNAIKERFSPRVFASDPITDKDLRLIFEAARLAPSGRNNQPWFYYWIRKTSPSYEKIKKCIPVRNSWALSAPLIIVACYDPNESIDGKNKWAKYDLGASVFSLILQAKEIGFYARQIGSFDLDLTKKIFPIPDPYCPFILIALGKIGKDKDYEKADVDIVSKENIPWSRKSSIDQEILT